MGHAFLIHSAILCLLIGAFNPFTFKIIIDRYLFFAILLPLYTLSLQTEIIITLGLGTPTAPWSKLSARHSHAGQGGADEGPGPGCSDAAQP